MEAQDIEHYLDQYISSEGQAKSAEQITNSLNRLFRKR